MNNPLQNPNHSQAAAVTNPLSPKDEKLISNQSHTLNDDYTLDLLAETAQVELSRFAVGKLQARKEIRTKTVQLPITLTQEVLVIEHVPHAQMTSALPSNFTDSAEPLQGQSAWINIERKATVPQTKILLNRQVHDLTTQPLEIVLSQEFANVQIQTHVAETVNLTTTTETQTQTIPVELRHEELVTETVNFDTPQLIASEILTDTAVTHTTPNMK